MTERTDTAEQILETARELVQTRGYNAFSYADIAAEIGIRTASIHYHFPSKSDLGRELVARYRDGFRRIFREIDAQTADPLRKLELYAQAYLQVLQDRSRMCLAGMLAADISTLAPPIREEVRGFFADGEEWLARVLAEGRAQGKLRFEGPPEAEAQLLVAGLEGAMLVARSYGDASRFEAMTRQMLGRLQP